MENKKITVSGDFDQVIKEYNSENIEQFQDEIEGASVYLEKNGDINLLTLNGFEINIPIDLALENMLEIWETDEKGFEKAELWKDKFLDIAERIDDFIFADEIK